MAKQIITQLLDDLDGGEADETVTFAMDGFAYTIDLSAKNASKLRDLMAPYQDAATRVGREMHGSSAQLRSVSRPASNREENGKIRVWAIDNGYEVSERGRIPQFVVDAYRTGTPAASKVSADKAAAEEVAEKIAQEVKAPAKRVSAKKAAPAAFSGKA